jgi:hypothetical protein
MWHLSNNFLGTSSSRYTHCVSSHKRFDTYIRVILSVYPSKSNLYLFGTQVVLILLQTLLLTLSLLLLLAGPFYDDSNISILSR